ncbi:hypothetical protein GCM10009839_37420 [Catenulispora yoronensis]|uniref:Uncharacterized protein n=1 Tax=Catenulispora yoronensis TaxID=450799 RepID=A0ABN2UAN4_9ACTN
MRFSARHAICPGRVGAAQERSVVGWEEVVLVGEVTEGALDAAEAEVETPPHAKAAAAPRANSRAVQGDRPRDAERRLSTRTPFRGRGPETRGAPRACCVLEWESAADQWVWPAAPLSGTVLAPRGLDNVSVPWASP